MTIAILCLIIILILMTLSSTILSISYLAWKVQRNKKLKLIKKDKDFNKKINEQILNLQAIKSKTNDATVATLIDLQIQSLQKQLIEIDD